jgi:hypothetical protein
MLAQFQVLLLAHNIVQIDYPEINAMFAKQFHLHWFLAAIILPFQL